MKTLESKEIISTLCGISQQKKLLEQKTKKISKIQIISLIFALLLLITDQIFSVLGAISIIIPIALEIVILYKRNRIKSDLKILKTDVVDYQLYLCTFYSMYSDNIEEDRKFKGYFQNNIQKVKKILNIINKEIEGD